jgi:hypothetical protein
MACVIVQSPYIWIKFAGIRVCITYEHIRLFANVCANWWLHIVNVVWRL